MVRRSLALLVLFVAAGCSIAPPPTPHGAERSEPALPTGPAGISPSPPSSPSPSPSPVATLPPPLPAGVVPVLYLHRVQAPPPAWPTWTAEHRASFLAYDVIPAAFDAQLDWLKANGYQTILPRDLAAHWDHGAALPPRPVIITLDDGWPSWTRTVLPALQQRGMVAEFYLTLAAVDNDFVTWGDVRALARAGMGIGCHDVHHVQLAGLLDGRPDASAAKMWDEINGCRVRVGEELGTPPDSMAYVGGGFDPRLVSLVAKAGYTTARSILRGIVQKESQRFSLRVIAIAAHDDVTDPYLGLLVPGLPTFAAKMAGAQT